MIGTDDDERRRRGIRGMARIGKVERSARLGKKRSVRRKRRRRWVRRGAEPHTAGSRLMADLVAEI